MILGAEAFLDGGTDHAAAQGKVSAVQGWHEMEYRTAAARFSHVWSWSFIWAEGQKRDLL